MTTATADWKRIPAPAKHFALILMILAFTSCSGNRAEDPDGDQSDVPNGTLHWDQNGHVYTGAGYTLQSGTFADEYHVFSIMWDTNFIRWYVNDNLFNEINITPGHTTEFHEEFFFTFNLAAGGNWPGNPDHTTIFPQRMNVDYIRVFREI